MTASANLDLVRSICAAWERGDFSSAEWADPEIEFVIAHGPTPGRWPGLPAMAEAWRDVLNAWENFRVEVDEYRELDSERILVLTRRSGRGKTSGLEIERMLTKGGVLLQIGDGKVARLVLYFDRDRALADLGLAQEGDSP